MATIFFSYSHKDEQLRDQLDVHLAALKRQNLIDAWHDRRITAGKELDSSIDTHLESAEIILCLMSPDFIASNYCYSREMERALERHRAGEARVIPVILRYCEWDQTPLSKLRGTPRDNKPVVAWSDRDEAFNDVTKDIRRALEELGHRPKQVGMSDAAQAVMKPMPELIRSRSANLHVKRSYTDLDRDQCLEETFEFLGEFFASSLHELKARHNEIDGKFMRLDANRFTVALYSEGKKRSAMTVFRGGMLGGGREIAFNDTDAGKTNSSNGGFALREQGEGLRFGNTFGIGNGGQKEVLDRSEVAEELWARFIEPLQR